MNNNMNYSEEILDDDEQYCHDGAKTFTALSLIYSIFALLCVIVPMCDVVILIGNDLLHGLQSISAVDLLMYGLKTLIFGLIPGILGLVFGIKTRWALKGMPDAAKAGLILSIVALGAWLSYFIVMFYHWGNVT